MIVWFVSRPDSLEIMQIRHKCTHKIFVETILISHVYGTITTHRVCGCVKGKYKRNQQEFTQVTQQHIMLHEALFQLAEDKSQHLCCLSYCPSTFKLICTNRTNGKMKKIRPKQNRVRQRDQQRQRARHTTTISITLRQLFFIFDAG